MKLAEIKNGRAYCLYCNIELNGGIVDHNAVKKDNESYLAYDRRCSHCGEVHRYYSDMQFENRFAFPDSEVQIIR